MLHIDQSVALLGYQFTFLPCVHRPTQQSYVIAPDHGSVETLHGTMTFRKGDYLLTSPDGNTLYCITAEAFAASYEA